MIEKSLFTTENICLQILKRSARPEHYTDAEACTAKREKTRGGEECVELVCYRMMQKISQGIIEYILESGSLWKNIIKRPNVRIESAISSDEEDYKG